jgi:hypothetical protein
VGPLTDSSDTLEILDGFLMSSDTISCEPLSILPLILILNTKFQISRTPLSTSRSSSFQIGLTPFVQTPSHDLVSENLALITSQDGILLLKPLMPLHTIEMLATGHQWKEEDAHKTESELDEWMAAAREALTGHEGHHGLSSGGKRIRMSYFWAHLGASPALERLEDVEVY